MRPALLMAPAGPQERRQVLFFIPPVLVVTEDREATLGQAPADMVVEFGVAVREHFRVPLAGVLDRVAAVAVAAGPEVPVTAEIPAWFLFIINRTTTMKSFLLILVAGLTTSVLAQSSSRFTITRGVVAGGGATFSSSTRFQLGSTIAQPLAAVPASARFSIRGGFWIWPAPILFAPTKIGTNFVVSIQTEPGKTYAVQYVTSLPPLNWQTLTTLAGDGTVKTVTNSAAGSPQQFFRLVEQ